jgi:hypothetical protein
MLHHLRSPFWGACPADLLMGRFLAVVFLVMVRQF